MEAVLYTGRDWWKADVFDKFSEKYPQRITTAKEKSKELDPTKTYLLLFEGGVQPRPAQAMFSDLMNQPMSFCQEHLNKMKTLKQGQVLCYVKSMDFGYALKVLDTEEEKKKE